MKKYFYSTIFFLTVSFLFLDCSGSEETKTKDQETENTTPKASDEGEVQTVGQEGGEPQNAAQQEGSGGHGDAGSPIPHLTSVFNSINYVHYPQAGPFKGSVLVSLGRDAETDPLSVKVVNLEDLSVTNTMFVCCTGSGFKVIPDEVLTTAQGVIYVKNTDNMGKIYRSLDQGKTWEQLASEGRLGSRKLRFIPLKQADNLRNGYFNHITEFTANAEGDLVLISAYSQPALTVIDHETGTGEFPENNLYDEFRLSSVSRLEVNSQGEIYVTGTTDDGDKYPLITVMTSDGGKTFRDVSQGGKLQYRGVYFDGSLIYNTETGRYKVNGKEEENALSKGILTRSDQYFLYPDGLIARKSSVSFYYSKDGGKTVKTFSPPDKKPIYLEGDIYFY